jgi:hypothetical protein
MSSLNKQKQREDSVIDNRRILQGLSMIIHNKEVIKLQRH